jgi:hypothetical protein
LTVLGLLPYLVIFLMALSIRWLAS